MAQILKFPLRSSKKPHNCKVAFFVKDNIQFALMPIDIEEMDKLIKRTAEWEGNLVFLNPGFFAYPKYFDRSGRIWPDCDKKKIVYK